MLTWNPKTKKTSVQILTNMSAPEFGIMSLLSFFYKLQNTKGSGLQIVYILQLQWFTNDLRINSRDEQFCHPQPELFKTISIYWSTCIHLIF